MSDPLIFEVSQSNFSDVVLFNSNKVPVVVEFMGVWSGPCIQLSDRISDLAKEFPGEFIFAKVDIDEQEALKDQYNITNVPTVLVFSGGEEKRREEGLLEEAELRVLLKQYDIFNPIDELREQAREKHLNGDTQSAIMLLTQAIQSDGSNMRVALDMVQIFLDIGEIDQAQSLFDRLPEQAHKMEMGNAITSQLNFIRLAQNTAGLEHLRMQVFQSPEDYQARFDLAICLIATHEIEKAMDELFFIQTNEPEFKDGAAREMIGMVCNMLANTNAQAAAAYRQKLASLLS